MTLPEPKQSVFDQASRGHRSMLLSQGLKIGCKLLSVLLLARLVPRQEILLKRANLARVLSLTVDLGLHLERVRRDIDSGVKSGVRATPGFFIAGKRQDVSFGLRLLFDATEAALKNV